ncbi:flagellar biosynthetic protein FliQ [Parvularcula maris]|jgi:flagellar biosynthetic protein FliQ|uniref:Flagellar biosynthetic protein FliQ n=1 Tax=Parvularcula maris TaxID=2965077 RepID=A0A9X2L9C1_9PROT|nr:flagellar biosynthetic protein FliQ [Parvularcula maris]MCQ8185496.1 flagellar biosynthetic protein FliQ [Parvularcula maris]
MTEADVIQIIREGFITAMIICAPPLIAGTLTGLAVALFQALTQIQEMTLTFVPKFVAIFVTIVLCLPLTFQRISMYAALIGDKVIRSGGGL